MSNFDLLQLLQFENGTSFPTKQVWFSFVEEIFVKIAILGPARMNYKRSSEKCVLQKLIIWNSWFNVELKSLHNANENPLKFNMSKILLVSEG